MCQNFQKTAAAPESDKFACYPQTVWYKVYMTEILTLIELIIHTSMTAAAFAVVDFVFFKFKSEGLAWHVVPHLWVSHET